MLTHLIMNHLFVPIPNSGQVRGNLYHRRLNEKLVPSYSSSCSNALACVDFRISALTEPYLGGDIVLSFPCLL